MKNRDRCRCGSPKFEERPRVFVDGTRHLELICASCGRYVKFIARTKDQARRFYFGKYKGRRIAEVIAIDRPYVQWLLTNVALKPTTEAVLRRLLEGDQGDDAMKIDSEAWGVKTALEWFRGNPVSVVRKWVGIGDPLLATGTKWETAEFPEGVAEFVRQGVGRPDFDAKAFGEGFYRALRELNNKLAAENNGAQ